MYSLDQRRPAFGRALPSGLTMGHHALTMVELMGELLAMARKALAKDLELQN